MTLMIRHLNVARSIETEVELRWVDQAEMGNYIGLQFFEPLDFSGTFLSMLIRRQNRSGGGRRLPSLLQDSSLRKLADAA